MFRRLPSKLMSARQRRWLLSGGIGSGKSEVRRILHDLGVHTIDADTVGHRVLEGPALAPVAERWPEVIEDGTIDRAALARIVFSDLAELRELETITHPLIFGRIEAELESIEEVAVVEAPLLEAFPDWPRIIVDLPDELRFRRMAARGMDGDDMNRRMASQPSRGEWLAAADLVVPNGGSLGDLKECIRKVVTHIRD